MHHWFCTIHRSHSALVDFKTATHSVSFGPKTSFPAVAGARMCMLNFSFALSTSTKQIGPWKRWILKVFVCDFWLLSIVSGTQTLLSSFSSWVEIGSRKQPVVLRWNKRDTIFWDFRKRCACGTFCFLFNCGLRVKFFRVLGDNDSSRWRCTGGRMAVPKRKSFFF